MNRTLRSAVNHSPSKKWTLPSRKWSWEKHPALTEFWNKMLQGCRPAEWGISGIVPVPKKGNLTIPNNYRGISLTQVVTKSTMPHSEQDTSNNRHLLRSNQNGFHQLRSTTSHILALRKIVEEIHNHNNRLYFFYDFVKAFDSINRNTMLYILCTNGIPELIVPRSETDTFKINTECLQGDPLAPFLFIICKCICICICICNEALNSLHLLGLL